LSLFDHLVGSREQLRGHGEAERLCGLEIDNEFVLGRRLHWKVRRLLALENAIDVSGRAAELIDPINPVGDQAAGGGIRAIGVDRGQPVSGGKRDHQIAITSRRRARCHDQTAIRRAGESCDGAFDLARYRQVAIQR
jgi:hypothetical protein